MTKKMHLVSLGCPKNLVDAELMLGILSQAGYTVTPDPEEASLLVVNTCGFIQPAVEEGIDTILEIAACKERDPQKKLVVTGCMVQRYHLALQQSLPEVDLFVGLDDFIHIDQLLLQDATQARIVCGSGAGRYLMDSSVPRRISTPFFRSYLKLTEGCDNRCTYCMIPAIRGQLRSRAPEDLLIEAQGLRAAGVQELSLIAQDLSAYGRDKRDGRNLAYLLRLLLEQSDIPWFRLLYLYPSGITDDILQLMAQSPRIVPYLDVPFQHVSDTMLHAMHRHYGRRELDKLVSRVRRFLPDAAIRTTLMVGFPGETRQDVAEMLAALQDWQLDHVGVFAYQDEEGSLAASLPGKISGEEKEERWQEVMELQAQISASRQQRFVGRIEAVLVEGLSEESDLLVEGRSRYQAPEIDGCVYIVSGTMQPGEIVPVRITEAHAYDLVGEIATEEVL